MKTLIAVDLDNTLLNKNKQITLYSQRILGGLQCKGVSVVFATARSMPDIRPYIYQVHPNAIIACGGAQVIFDDERQIDYFLDDSIANRLIKALLSNPYVNELKVVCENGIFSNNTYTCNKHGYIMYSSFHQARIQRAHKITVTANSLDLLKTLKAYNSKCSIFKYRESKTIMITDKLATKGEALKTVSTVLGIPMNNIIAFGDDASDADMLRYSGKGIAMNNAEESIRQIATEICASNDEDGVAKWIDRNL